MTLRGALVAVALSLAAVPAADAKPVVTSKQIKNLDLAQGAVEDAYANAHRIPVEERKRGVERGRYLHPELFGQPLSKTIGRR